ncbi:hypothetical protein AB0D59_50225 [Streptomyces sp. NPDC048417]|uniref:hypothetical protein n=1 Tax=Streptomyces sp. NPDC048417 TaxID=3155387 RepID=UPI0034147BBB
MSTEIRVASLLPVPALPNVINPHTEYVGDHLTRWSREVMALPAAEAAHWRAAHLERLAGCMYPTAGPPLLTLIGEARYTCNSWPGRLPKCWPVATAVPCRAIRCWRGAGAPGGG